MIPDGLQYFLDHFWNFQNVHQILPLTFLFYHQRISKNTRTSMESSLKILFPYLDMSELQKIQNFRHRRTSQMCLLLFLSFSGGYDGSKTIGISERFQRFFGGGILINIGTLKIIKILKHK